MKYTPATVEYVEYDGKFTVTYRTSDLAPSQSSSIRVVPAMGRLIAAAPDLLAVAKDILSFLESRGYDATLVKAAIAKAEGATEGAEK